MIELSREQQNYPLKRKCSHMSQEPFAFWALPLGDLFVELKAGELGLSEAEAARRQRERGLNQLRSKRELSTPFLFLAQFKSPIILLLVFAAVLSAYLSQTTDATIILIIILISGLLGFWQESRAAEAMARLLAVVQIRALVRREGKEKEIPLEEIVFGDIVLLKAGDIIPGDGRILNSRDLFVNESTLTGETYPAEKTVGLLPDATELSQRSNCLFMGTNVVSGTATLLVIKTGQETEFGQVSQRLRFREPETDFEKGVKRFGYFLMEVTFLLVVAIFAINVYLARPILESFLFSLALAVGLTPQLLPAIISINLAHGASIMASRKVIVKRLASIENFGSMNILCCDKTGTLTEGCIRLHSALDPTGRESDEVFLFAYLNAFFETGFSNPLDQAILSHKSLDSSGYKKLDEVPYDFIRKRLSILVSKGQEHMVITKGALASILAVCTKAKTAAGIVEMEQLREDIQRIFQDNSEKGFRVLGVSYKISEAEICNSRDESGMTFLGFLVFFDPPKAGIAEIVANLAELGVDLKVITGDNRLVASSLARQVGLSAERVLTGQDLHVTSDEALLNLVEKTEIFAELEPFHKERLILALRQRGNVVGFLGDGINDASALHAADVGISVEGAVDVAKGAADIVLLEKDLSVLLSGVQEGRKTFANTMKYVFMATSANFGNMFSMALLSLFLPFLPLLPTQVLLTNLLTDLPEMTIAGDSVDPELVYKPRRWSIGFIRDFMITFGLLSSLFDYLTFGVLLFLLHAGVEQFRTGWFMESVVSASLVVLVIRTRRPFFRSRPSRYLIAATVVVCAAALLIPNTPLAALFQFSALPAGYTVAVVVIVLAFLLTAEAVKSSFYRRIGHRFQ
jgi:Mg2+-importing ATPase